MNCVDTVLFGQVCDNCDGGAVFKILSLVVNILSAGIIVAATIGIIIVGAKILTSRDNADVVARAKKRLFEIVIGLVAYSLFYAILNFIIPGGVMTSTLDSSTTSCPDKMSGGSTKSLKELSQIPVNKDGNSQQSSGGQQQQQQMVDSSMGDIIARAAATYSHPVQSSQKDWDIFYDTSKAGETWSGEGLKLTYYGDAQDGKCYNPQYKRWDNYRGPADDCVLSGGRASYRYAATVNHTGALAYCDRFLSSVIYSLGLQSGDSGNFPVTGPTSQGRWFNKSSNWTEIENHGKDMLNGTAGVEQLKPGDVLQMDENNGKSGHVAIYVGEYGGSYGKLAEASSSGKFPRITPFLEGAYHKTIGGKNMFALASDRKYHIYRYTGPMTETAKNSPFNGTVAQSEPEQPVSGGKTFPRQANTYWERAGLSYYLHVPEGATENMPLIIYLHGVGEVKSPSRVANLPQVKALESASASKSFIGIAPVQPDDSFSSRAVFNRIKALIDETVDYYKINPNRIYIAGFSMGGAHTWCMVDQYPTFFKAAAPISMGTKNSCAGSGPNPGHFTHTKVWAQAGGSETNHIKSMQSFVDQINASGGSAQFSTVGNYDHGGCQKNVDNNAIFNWLLAQ